MCLMFLLTTLQFEHPPPVSLVWHDLELQRFSSTIVGIEEPLGLMPTGNASSRTNYSVLECYEGE